MATSPKSSLPAVAKPNAASERAAVAVNLSVAFNHVLEREHTEETTFFIYPFDGCSSLNQLHLVYSGSRTIAITVHRRG